MSTFLNFDSEIILENSSVRLEPLAPAHKPALLPYSLNEPELWTYSLVSAAGQDNLETYINLALNKRKAHDSYAFVIIDKSSGHIAGSTRFYDYQPNHNTVQLGYTWLGKKYQKTGINRSCKQLMLTYAFESIKVERLEFRADVNNHNSISAMEAIGCQREGILRSNCASPFGRRSSIILSILKDEWEQSVKSKLDAMIKYNQSL